MNRKVAILDSLGAHGSSHHFYLFGQAEGLLKQGVSLSLYTNNVTDNPKIKGLRFFNFYKDIYASDYKVINGLRWLLGTLYSVFHARLLGNSVFHFHIFHMDIFNLFNIFLVKSLFGKVVLTVHDVSSFSNSSEFSIVKRMIYKFTDLILTHNEFSKSEIIKTNINFSSRLFIIPHGNYTPFINIQDNKEKSRNKLGIPNDKKVLLFFGMIKRVKGLEILLYALKDVIKEHSNVLLVVAGKPWKNDFRIYQRIIDKNNLSEHVLLHTKFIPYEDVEHYYCATDLVVLPYKRIYQSGVLVMSLSYGKPILLSDLPSLKEVVVDMETAFMFKSENSRSLAKKLNLILLDTEKLEQVSRNGKKLINTKYSWSEIGRQTKLAYQSLY